MGRAKRDEQLKESSFDKDKRERAEHAKESKASFTPPKKESTKKEGNLRVDEALKKAGA